MATVPESRIIIQQHDGAGYDVAAISNSVRSREWVDAARLQCWLAGRGATVVPCHCPMVTVNKGTASTFAYWTKPRYQTTRYAYTFVLTSTTATACTIKIGSTSHSVRVTEPRSATPVTIYVDRAAQNTTEAELSFELTAPSSYDITLMSVSIEAVPRAILPVDANNLGAERLDFWVRQPITVNNLATQLLSRQNDLRDSARRVGQFQFSRGISSPWAITTASPSWIGLFDDGVSALGRYLYSSDTARGVRWRVLVKCSDGTTAGAARINNKRGTAVSTITIPTGTTAWTWLPTGANGASVQIDAEDNTTANGLRGGTHDDQVFQAQRTAGAGTISIASVSLYEA